MFGGGPRSSPKRVVPARCSGSAGDRHAVAGRKGAVARVVRYELVAAVGDASAHLRLVADRLHVVGAGGRAYRRVLVLHVPPSRGLVLRAHDVVRWRGAGAAVDVEVVPAVDVGRGAGEVRHVLDGQL